jgi:hypothetical protein
MWARCRLYALRVSRGGDPRFSGSVRQGLLLVLALLTVPAVSAEEIAVRVRNDGRVDLRVKSVPLVSVLDRLAGLTEMKLAYQGPSPRRLVTLEVYAASQAEAVLHVLEGLGIDYAVSTNPAGTRILSLVVADAARPAGARPDPETVEHPESVELAAPPVPDAAQPDAIEPGNAESGEQTSTEGFPLLPGDYVPGGRATGQTTEWGAPPFVLPDPPGPASSDATTAASEPDASVSLTEPPSPPHP